MRPGTFDYVAPASVPEAVSILATDESAKVLAGGQSLVPLMNLRLATPGRLVDINQIPEIDFVRVADQTLHLGSLTRHRRLEFDLEIARAAPLLTEASRSIGHPQVRNRGTLGGSLAHADPSAELACALLALEADVVVEGRAGRRDMSMPELLDGFFTTTLDPDELICEIRVPVTQRGRGAALGEYSPRASDFAVASVVVSLDFDDEQRCTRARAAAGAVGPTAVDLSDALAELIGERSLSEGLLRHVAAMAAEAVTPPSDLRASAEDRRDLLQVLLVRTMPIAWQRAADSLSNGGTP